MTQRVTFRSVRVLLPLLITIASFGIIGVNALTLTQLRAQSLLTPAADRSIWTFSSTAPTSSSSSASPTHFSSIPPTTSQPPPPPASFYPANFSVATLNGRDQYVDMNTQADGASRSITNAPGDYWSFSCWFYVDSLTSQYKSHIFFSRSTTQMWTVNMSLVIYISASNQLLMSYLDERGGLAGSGFAGWGNHGVTLLRQWMHIGLTYNVTEGYRFFLGGLQIGAPYTGMGGALTSIPELTYSSTLGKSDLTLFANSMLPFQGSFYAAAWFDFALPPDDMLALGTPQTAQTLIAASTVTYTTFISNAAILGTSNPLTSAITPWKYYLPNTIAEYGYVDFQGQSPSIFITPFFGGTTAWTISFYLQLPTTTPTTDSILFHMQTANQTKIFQLKLVSPCAIALTYGTAPTPYVIPGHLMITSSSGEWLTQNGSFSVLEWNRITISYDGDPVQPRIYSYINDVQVSSYVPNIQAETPTIYTNAYIGSDGSAPETLEASIFGLTIWQGYKLTQSDMTAIMIPSIVEYTHDAPTTVAAGSTILITFTASLKLSTSSLAVRGGAGLLIVWQKLDFSPSQQSYRVAFNIPSTRTQSTYTISFEAVAGNQTIPQPICMEVIDPSTAVDSGLTVLTARQLLDTADWTLPFSAPFTGNASCLPRSAPSGIPNERILTCQGGTYDFIDDSMTNGVTFPGIDENPAAFTFAFWLNPALNQSTVDLSPIFTARNQDAIQNRLQITLSYGKPSFLLTRPGTLCTATYPTSVISGNAWQHVAVTYGDGGCSVWADGEIGVISGQTQTNTWMPKDQHPLNFTQFRLGSLIQPNNWNYNGSYGSVHFWNRMLSQREIVFLAANKPHALQIPTTRQRHIGVFGLPSASQLLAQSAFLHTFDRAPSPGHGQLISAPSGASGYHVVAFDGLQTSPFDLLNPVDVATGSGPVNRIFPSIDEASTILTFSFWFQYSRIIGGLSDSTLFYLSDTLNTSRIEIRPTEVRIISQNNVVCLASLSAGQSPLLSTCASCFTHIATTINYPSLCSLYLNGQRVATGTFSDSWQWPTAYAFIGDPTQNNRMKGMIAHFAYWQRALTGIEINRLANTPPPSVALPPAAKLTVAETILASSDYDFVASRAYQLEVVYSNVDINQPNDLGVNQYNGSLIAYTDLYDITQVHTGLSYRFPYFTSPSISLAVWVFIPPRNDTPAYSPCIFSANVPPAQAEEISLRHVVNNSGSDIEFRLQNGPLTICHLRMLNNVTIPFPTNTWIHIVATFDTRGICSLYLNGALVASAPGASTLLGITIYFPGIEPTFRNEVNLAACQVSDSVRFIGSVAQFTMWQRALDQAEVAVLYTQPPPSIIRLVYPSSSASLLDASTPPRAISEWSFVDKGVVYSLLTPGGATFSRTGDPTASTTGVNLMVPESNPTTKQVMPIVFGGESFSFTMWMQAANTTSILSTPNGTRLLECSSDSDVDPVNGENILALGLLGDWSYYFEVSVPLANRSTPIVNRITTPPSMLLPQIIDQWNHIGVVYDADTQLVMITQNGAIVKTASWRTLFSPAALRAVRQRCYLGLSRNPSAFEQFDMQIQSFAYYNVALTPAQILSLYHYRRGLHTTVKRPRLSTNDLLFSSTLIYSEWQSGQTPGVPSSPYAPPIVSYAYGLNFTGSSRDGLGQYIDLTSSLDIGFIQTTLPPPRILSPDALAVARIVGLTISLGIYTGTTPLLTTHIFEWHSESDPTSYMVIRIQSTYWQVAVYKHGAIVCSVSWPLFVMENGYRVFSFVFTPDNRIELWANSQQVASSGASFVCAAASSGVNAASSVLLPWMEPGSTTGRVTFGGGPAVDGITTFGLTGYGTLVTIFTRALTGSEFRILYGTYGTPTPYSSLESADFQWRFIVPPVSSPSRITYDAAPSGVGSVGRFAGADGGHMVLTDFDENPYSSYLPLGSIKVTMGMSTWIKFTSLNVQGAINANNSVIVEWLTDHSASNRIRLSILSEDTTLRKGYRLSFMFSDVNDNTIFQTETQSNSLRANEWTHIVFATTWNPDLPLRAVIYINGALCVCSPLTQYIPNADRATNYGYNALTNTSTLDAQVADISFWGTFANVVQFTPDVVLDLYRSPPPQLAGTLGTEFDRLLMSAAARYDCTQPTVNTNLSTSQVVWKNDLTGVSYCDFNSNTGKASPWLDLMNPFDNPAGPIIPPYLSTNISEIGVKTLASTVGLTISMHLQFSAFPVGVYAMYLFSIDSYSGATHCSLRSTSGTSHTIYLDWTDGQGGYVLSLSIMLQWSQLSLRTSTHMAWVITPTLASLYLNGQFVRSGSSGVIQSGPRTFAAFGRDTGTMSYTNFQGQLGLFALFSRALTEKEVKLLAAYTPPSFVTSSQLTSAYLTPNTYYAGWNQTLLVASSTPLTCNARVPSRTQVTLTNSVVNVDSIQCDQVRLLHVVNSTVASCITPIEVSTTIVTTQFSISPPSSESSANPLLFTAPPRSPIYTWTSFISSLSMVVTGLPSTLPNSSISVSPEVRPTTRTYLATLATYTPSIQFNFFISAGMTVACHDTESGATYQLDSRNTTLTVSISPTSVVVHNFTFTTSQQGVYTISITATDSSKNAIPFKTLAVVESAAPSVPLSYTNPLSLSTLFSYIVNAPVHTALVSYSLSITCVVGCQSVLYSKGVKVQSLVDGMNLISLGTPQVGALTLQLLSPSITPYYQNYTIVVNVPQPQPDPCLLACQNGGTCINQVSTTYNTAYTCFCTALYQGSLCQTPVTVPYQPTYPTAVISASATTVTDCQNATFDGSDSYGLGPIGLKPYYLWSLTSIKITQNGGSSSSNSSSSSSSTVVELVNTADPTYNASLAATTFAGLDPATFLIPTTTTTLLLPQTAVILFAGKQLLNDATYTLGLIVGNLKETSTQKTVTIVKVALASAVAWTPTVGIRLPNLITRPSVTVGSVIITPSSCQLLPNDLILSYAWSITLVAKLASASSSLLPAVNDIPFESRSFVSSTPGSFSIQSNFLRVGYVYSVTLNLNLTSPAGSSNNNNNNNNNNNIPSRRLLATGAETAITTATVSLIPSSSPITARIFGSDRTKPIDSSFSLTADQSIDPDYVVVNNDDATSVNDVPSSSSSSYGGLTFAWSCKEMVSGIPCSQLTTTTTGGPAGGVMIDLNQVRVDVPSGVMSIGVTYQWTVTVTSIIDISRTSTATVRVTGSQPSLQVEGGKSPLVTILNAPIRMNSDQTLRLSASVVTQTSTPIIDMQYLWSLICITSLTPLQPSDLPSLQQQSNLGSSSSGSGSGSGGVNTSSLVLKPYLLLIPGEYQFSVIVTDPNTVIINNSLTHNALLASATTSVTIIVNARPQPGDCTITPSSGIALETVFTLICRNWYEPLNANFAPFTYSISYRADTDNALNADDDDPTTTTTTTTTTTYQQLTTSSLSSSRSFLLPSGSISLRTIITDQVGASSEFDLPIIITVQVSPQALFDLMAYIANLTYVQLPQIISAGGGDSLASISFIHQIADQVNKARTMSQYSDSMSQSKLLQFNIDLIVSHQSVITSVLQLEQSSLDTTALSIITQSLLPLTQYASQLPFDSIAILTKEVTVTLNSALLSSTTTTTTQIEPTSAVKDLTTILSNLMTQCSQLDVISNLVHESMRLRQIHAIAGESIELASINYYAYVERTLVAAGTEIHLPTGESVILTPKAMKNYILRLNQLNISTIDTGGGGGTMIGAAEMDTRIVTFSSRWSSCRTKSTNGGGGGISGSGSSAISDLTNIEITFPNGDLVDIPSLDTDIIFTIPISKNSTDSILDLAREGLPCPASPFDRLTIANTSFTCQFWNVTTQSYSSIGCYSLGVTFLLDGSTSLKCSCSHLTEFAILYAEAQNLYNTDVCADIEESNLGSSVYLIFLIIYVFVGLIAMIQLIRVLTLHGIKKFIFITLEHALILAMCIFRAVNQSMYYSLYKDISISKQIVISSLPYLFYSWIFTLVIVTWASIWATSARGEKNDNPLKPYKLQFFIGNLSITTSFLIIFGLMSQTTDLNSLRTLNRVGVALTCIVEMGFGLFLVIYGLLLVRALTEHFVSPYAKKLGAIAISFSIAFGVSAAILAYSVAEEDAFARHSVAYNSVYFTLDIIGLLLVMFLFAKSISKASGSDKSTRDVSMNGGSHSHNPLSKSGQSSAASSKANGHSRNTSSRQLTSSRSEAIQLASVQSPVSRAITSPSNSTMSSRSPPARKHQPPSFVMNSVTASSIHASGPTSSAASPVASPPHFSIAPASPSRTSPPPLPMIRDTLSSRDSPNQQRSSTVATDDVQAQQHEHHEILRDSAIEMDEIRTEQ